MALLMGLGGGITRDVLINQVPAALTNPAYLTVCLAAALIGYRLAYAKGQLFREGLFQFMTSFSLPLYAIVGAQKGVEVGLPVAGVLVLAVVGPTAGRWYVDVSSGVPPKQFVRGEWFVATALLTGIIWVLCDTAGLNTWVCAGIALVIGYTVRVLALYYAWEEPLAKNPQASTSTTTGAPCSGASSKASQNAKWHPWAWPSPRTPHPPITRPSGSTDVLRQAADHLVQAGAASADVGRRVCAVPSQARRGVLRTRW